MTLTFDLWPDNYLLARTRGGLSCGTYDDCNFNRFGFIVLTNTETDATQKDRLTVKSIFPNILFFAKIRFKSILKIQDQIPSCSFKIKILSPRQYLAQYCCQFVYCYRTRHLELTSGSHPGHWFTFCVLPSPKNLPIYSHDWLKLHFTDSFILTSPIFCKSLLSTGGVVPCKFDMMMMMMMIMMRDSVLHLLQYRTCEYAR